MLVASEERPGELCWAQRKPVILSTCFGLAVLPLWQAPRLRDQQKPSNGKEAGVEELLFNVFVAFSPAPLAIHSLQCLWRPLK